MKKFFLLLATFSVPIFATINQQIEFAGITFEYAWSSDKGGTTVEYVETGKTLDNWQHLLAYRVFKSKKVATVINSYLKQIKPTQKPAIYKNQNSDSDLMLVFLMMPEDKSYVEFNIHRFVLEDGAVRSYQFASRDFQRESSELIDEIKTKKGEWMKLIGKLQYTDFENK